MPATILRAETTLPLPAVTAAEASLRPYRSRHSADWWAKTFAGFKFSREDLNPPEAFNRALWQGLMGDKPYPAVRQTASREVSRN